VEVLSAIPAIGEFVPRYEANGWIGIGVPKNTPAPIVEKLNAEINAVIAVAGTRARLVDLGVEPIPLTSAEFGKLIAAESEKWAKVAQFAGIRPE
jgi:tripartite-type tricarboxylate transporter receptor subunit TctC